VKCDNLSYKRGLGRNRCLAQKHNLQILAETVPVPISGASSGDLITGRLKGSQVQHDTMPFYLEEIVISDLANG
jgi:hypothetical protein